jgi:hypothetical protein
LIPVDLNEFSIDAIVCWNAENSFSHSNWLELAVDLPEAKIKILSELRPEDVTNPKLPPNFTVLVPTASGTDDKRKLKICCPRRP